MNNNIISLNNPGRTIFMNMKIESKLATIRKVIGHEFNVRELKIVKGNLSAKLECLDCKHEFWFEFEVLWRYCTKMPGFTSPRCHECFHIDRRPSDPVEARKEYLERYPKTAIIISRRVVATPKKKFIVKIKRSAEAATC